MTRFAMVVVCLMTGCMVNEEEVSYLEEDAVERMVEPYEFEEADIDLLFDDLDESDFVASDVCPENDEDTENSPYTGAWCGFTSGGKSHGCCNGAQCVGPPSGSGSFPGRCCYCIMPGGQCGSYGNCVNQTPKWDCVMGSIAVRLSPFCSTCGSPWGHNAGPDGICNNADDTY